MQTIVDENDSSDSATFHVLLLYNSAGKTFVRNSIQLMLVISDGRHDAVNASGDIAFGFMFPHSIFRVPFWNVIGNFGGENSSNQCLSISFERL